MWRSEKVQVGLSKKKGTQPCVTTVEGPEGHIRLLPLLVFLLVLLPCLLVLYLISPAPRLGPSFAPETLLPSLFSH